MKKGLSRYIFWLICSSFPFLLFSLKFVEQTRLFAKFARNWLAAPRTLHLQHDAMRSSFMIFPPFYRWENWGLENTCLAQTSITKEVAEPKPPVFHPEKKKNGTSFSEHLVQYQARTEQWRGLPQDSLWTQIPQTRQTMKSTFPCHGLCFYFYFLSHYKACGILVLWPGWDLHPLHWKHGVLNHWTAREVSHSLCFFLSVLS